MRATSDWCCGTAKFAVFMLLGPFSPLPCWLPAVCGSLVWWARSAPSLHQQTLFLLSCNKYLLFQLFIIFVTIWCYQYLQPILRPGRSLRSCRRWPGRGTRRTWCIGSRTPAPPPLYCAAATADIVCPDLGGGVEQAAGGALRLRVGDLRSKLEPQRQVASHEEAKIGNIRNLEIL